MVAPILSDRHSARVRLQLKAGDHLFQLAQVGGGRLFFDTPVILPGTSGEVCAQIDAHEQHWTVTWTPCEQPRTIISAHFREIRQKIG